MPTVNGVLNLREKSRQTVVEILPVFDSIKSKLKKGGQKMYTLKTVSLLLGTIILIELQSEKNGFVFLLKLAAVIGCYYLATTDF